MNTKNIPYSLEVGSKKFTCPKCERKTFVRFINTETGKYLSEKYGRCDREVKCGYFMKPEKQNTDEFSITPIWQMTQTLKNYEGNVLIKTLADRFGVEAVNKVLKKFYIGTGSGKYEGWSIFWQVDSMGYIRTGHMMQYIGLSRTKFQNWTHSLIDSNYRLKQCFFGLNQLKEIPRDKQINVVESEKSAIICSIYFPGETWMSTAGRHGLKNDTLIALYPHPVKLYPDNDSIGKWKEVANSMNNVNVVDWQHDFFGYTREIERLKQGADIADFLTCHTINELMEFSLN